MTRADSITQSSIPDAVLDEAFVDLTGSDFSFWHARVWKFRHSNPAKPIVRLIWEFTLPSGGLSTGCEHMVLLEGFKTVVWGMLTNDAYGRPASVGTVGSIGVGVREAFRWFAWKGIWNFSQVSPAVQEQYLNDLPRLIVEREEVYPGFVAEGYNFGYHSRSLKSHESETADAEGDVEGGLAAADPAQEDGGISYHQVSNRINVIFFVHAQRALLAKRELPVFTATPFKGKSVGDLSSSIAAYVINRIPALPQAVGVPLLVEVLRWVDDVAPNVARAHSLYQTARMENQNALIGAFMLLDAAGLTEERLALLPWREKQEEGGKGSVDSVGSGHHRMRLASLTYRDACVLALQYLAGLRISEVCSPKVFKRKVGGLASCLYKRVSPDGLMDLYFLKGMTVKGRSTPKPTDWVVGCVPRGSDQLPVLVRALDQLHDLFSHFYSDDKEMPLFLHFGNPHGMPSESASCVQADGIALLRGSRRFIRCFVDLSDLADFDQFGNSLVLYRESQGQCIRTHQGRKTFADFCLKTRKSALSALSFHYGHLTEAITYAGYYEPIQRLADDLETMAYSATVDFFVSRAEGKTVFGNMAEAVERFLLDFGLKSVKDLTLLRAKIERIVWAHDIRIYFGEHGNCFMSVTPMQSRCQQAAGGASWMLRRPSYLTRTVSMCAGCNCFLLDESHRAYWEKRAESWAEAAQDPTNRVAVKSYQQSRIVLRYFKKADDAVKPCH